MSRTRKQTISSRERVFEDPMWLPTLGANQDARPPRTPRTSSGNRHPAKTHATLAALIVCALAGAVLSLHFLLPSWPPTSERLTQLSSQHTLAHAPRSRAHMRTQVSHHEDQQVILALARAVSHLQQQVPPSGASARAKAYAAIGLPPQGQNLTALKRNTSAGETKTTLTDTRQHLHETASTQSASDPHSPPWSGWRLIAVSSSGVVIARHHGSDVRVIRLHQRFAGWRLISVHPGAGRASLAAGHLTVTLSMFDHS